MSGSISLLTYETRIAKPARKRTKVVTIVDRALIPNDLTIVDASKDIALKTPYTLVDLEERSLYLDTAHNQWLYKNMLRTDRLLWIRYRSAALVPRKQGSEVIVNSENGTVTIPPDIPRATTMLKLNRVFYRKHTNRFGATTMNAAYADYLPGYSIGDYRLLSEVSTTK